MVGEVPIRKIQKSFTKYTRGYLIKDELNRWRKMVMEV